MYTITLRSGRKQETGVDYPPSQTSTSYESAKRLVHWKFKQLLSIEATIQKLKAAQLLEMTFTRFSEEINCHRFSVSNVSRLPR